MAARLQQIRLEIDIAGQHMSALFPPQPNQRYDFTWNGLDAYGRTVTADQMATITLSYIYPVVYRFPRAASSQSTDTLSRAFALASQRGAALEFREDQSFAMPKTWRVPLRAFTPQPAALGAWSLTSHHSYDARGGVIYYGHGTERSARSVAAVIETVDARVAVPYGVAVAPDGSVYIADNHDDRILRVTPDGRITTAASVGNPLAVAAASDGSLYVVLGVGAIDRVAPDGSRTRVAGRGGDGLPSLDDDGSLATDVIIAPSDVVPLPDQSFYIVEAEVNRIRWVSPDGVITTIAGTGDYGFSGDGGQAAQAHFAFPTAAAVAPDGSLYIADTGNGRIRRIRPDGKITTVAGTGEYGLSGDGEPAIQAQFAFPTGVAVAPDGSLYITDADNYRIRRVGLDGVMATVVGNGLQGYRGDGGPSLQASFDSVASVAVAPNGHLYLADTGNHRIRRVRPTLSHTLVSDVLVPSTDGTQLYHFNSAGRHQRTLDTLTGSEVALFLYDDQGRLSTITDAYGAQMRIERDAAGQPTALVAPDGQRTVLTLHPQGYLASVTNPAGEKFQMTYADGGLLTTFTTPRNAVHRFTYTASGRLVQDLDPSGGGWAITREEHPQGYTTRLTSGEGRATAFTVTPLTTGDRLQRNTSPDGTVQTTRFTTQGEVIRTAPDGTVATRLAGPDPRFGMQVPLPSTVTVTTPSGLTATTHTARTVTSADPHDFLSLTGLTDIITRNGRSSTRTYEALTRTWHTTSPAGRQQTTVLDTQGRPVQTQIVGLAPVAVSYDARGRLSALTVGDEPDARTTTLRYYDSGPAQGLPVQITNALGQTVQFAYDAAGRVTAQTLPDGRDIRYSYDAHGNVTSLTPPGRPAHAFAYTPLDQEAQYTPPDVGDSAPATQYTYNRDRQLTRILRPDGQTVTLGYTTGGQPATLSTPHGLYQFSYDPVTGQPRTVMDPDGGTLDYTHDGMLPVSTSWSGLIAGSVTWTRNHDFRVATLAVNTQAVPFAYDADGLLVQAGALTLTRDGATGLLTGTTLGGVRTAHTYSAFGKISTAASTVLDTPHYAVTYARDGLGRLTTQTETLAGVTTMTAYTYDLAGRLATVTVDGTLVATLTYDANGNRLQHNGTIGTYDTQDRLLQYGNTTYTYTPNGDLHTQTDTVTAQSTTYTYDVFGNLRMVHLPVGTILTYRIDSRQRRIGKQVNGVLVQGFLYQDQLRPIAELDGTGHVVARFVYADRTNVPAYLEKGGRVYRILADHLGSPRLVVDTTDGTIVQRMDYDVFGQVVRDTNPGFQPFGFAGGLYDRDTGLVRFGARDYDPRVGRWTSKDPVRFAGRDTNLYGYVLNDPVNFVDPSGQAWQAVLGALLGPEVAVVALVAYGLYLYVDYMLSEPGPPVGLMRSTTPPTPPTPPTLPQNWDGTTPPLPGWTWQGPDAPGGARGGWVSPDKRQSLHGDFQHGGDIGPHVDWNTKNPTRNWRIFPDGRCEPK